MDNIQRNLLWASIFATSIFIDSDNRYNKGIKEEVFSGFRFSHNCFADFIIPFWEFSSSSIF